MPHFTTKKKGGGVIACLAAPAPLALPMYRNRDAKHFGAHMHGTTFYLKSVQVGQLNHALSTRCNL